MPRRFLLVILIVVAGCRRDVPRLDDVQKMAYEVRPAVVRISAIATAEFHYPREAVLTVEKALKEDAATVKVRNLPDGDGVVETGAGGSGSGFIIHPDGWILTSGHVVAPTRDAEALQRDLRRNGSIAALVKHFPIEELRAIRRDEGLDRYIRIFATAGTIEKPVVVNDVELSNGEKLPFRIRRFEPALTERGTDLALLQIARKNLPTVFLGDSMETRVGESIWAVGYPAVASSSDDVIGGWLSADSDLEPTFNPGTITAIKRNVTNTPVFQSNVAIYRGNSGGPAVNREGAVIGISTWGHTSAEQIKFLVPINVAKDFLAKAGVQPNVEGDFNRYYRASLDAASEGHWPQARKSLELAARLFPNSPDLIRFRSDVDRSMRKLPLWALYPVWSAVGVVFLGALLSTGVALAARSRSRLPKELAVATTAETLVNPNGNHSPSTILGKFTILNGTRAGEKLGLGGSGIRIGRERTVCEIVLENPKVSRLHAEVVSIDGKVLLIDRNSSNGTYVNDQKIDKRFLQDGDIIYFGGRNAVAVAFHA